MSAEAVAKVPGENLRVSRAEFGAVWALAEHLGGQPGDGGDYLLGVILTCEWLADQPVPSVVAGSGGGDASVAVDATFAASDAGDDRVGAAGGVGAAWRAAGVGAGCGGDVGVGVAG